MSHRGEGSIDVSQAVLILDLTLLAEFVFGGTLAIIAAMLVARALQGGRRSRVLPRADRFNSSALDHELAHRSLLLGRIGLWLVVTGGLVAVSAGVVMYAGSGPSGLVLAGCSAVVVIVATTWVLPASERTRRRIGRIDADGEEAEAPAAVCQMPITRRAA